MTKVLSFTLTLFFTFTLQAQVHFTDFGDGWIIPSGANEALDVNNDGTIDFYINGYQNEIGFESVGSVGCLRGSSLGSYNNLGTLELLTFQDGAEIMMTYENTYNYIDDDRTAIYNPGLGFADGWSQLEEKYIGFIVFESLTSEWIVRNGWMKIAVDAEAETLIIKSMAYGEPTVRDEGGIAAGAVELSVGLQTIEQLDNVKVVPNPASEFMQLHYNYAGNESLSIVIYNSIGKEFYQLASPSSGRSNLNIEVSVWPKGIYFVRFETSKGVQTKQFSIL